MKFLVFQSCLFFFCGCVAAWDHHYTTAVALVVASAIMALIHLLLSEEDVE